MYNFNLRDIYGRYGERAINEYEQFSYGFFAVWCMALGILVHINHNFMLYDYYFGELSSKFYNIMVKLRIVKDDEELPLYAPLVKCNSEHDIRNSVYISINPNNPIIIKEQETV